MAKAIVEAAEKKTPCAFCKKKKFPYRRHGRWKTGLEVKIGEQLLMFCGNSHKVEYLFKLASE